MTRDTGERSYTATPRTDALYESMKRTPDDSALSYRSRLAGEMFAQARHLERELADKDATIRELREALTTARAEIATLAPRLTGPYRANLKILSDLINAALAKGA